MKAKLSFLSVFFILACSAANTPTSIQDPIESGVIVGSELQANRYANVYFSAQPTTKDLKALKKQGFVHVINLRDASEYDEQGERKLVESEGIHYSNVPFKKTDELSDEYVEAVTQTLKKHRKDGKTLVHCSSGNRVAIWLGGHFLRDHKYTASRSRELAVKLGLSKDTAAAKLDRYLESNSEGSD